MTHKLTDFLPTTRKEMDLRGWDQADIILFSGDAYVDHPSFGAAVIGRVLEAHGYKVAIVPQPDWRGDYRDFKKLGTPRLFFGVSPGAMDSMVNHYTAAKRLRSDDAYSPDKRAGLRPDYPSIVYTNILKELYPQIPVILGGIEPSMRRLAHYDYWQDKLLPSIIIPSNADMILYGMGERAVLALAKRVAKGETITQIRDLPQSVFATTLPFSVQEKTIQLHSFEECLQSKAKQAENFRRIDQTANQSIAPILTQSTGQKTVVVNPPYPTMKQEEVDLPFDLPYTRIPHPKYKGKEIPAYQMIKHSLTLHRGCFGGCSFCAIAGHQGKFIASRSESSILKEVEKITQMEDFKGTLSDLGGPSANMYAMEGTDKDLCHKCSRPSCLWPKICPNLNTDHTPLLKILNRIEQNPAVKHSFVSSGIRYDLALYRSNKHPERTRSAEQYLEKVITRHVSGRLKIAPEHTDKKVLDLMRKNDFNDFGRFKEIFDKSCQKAGLQQQLIPYFISGHPGSTLQSMAELAVVTKSMNFHLEQVQDFTPTPMTLSTEMFYTGLHPYTMEKIFVPRSIEEKKQQKLFFFWYDKQAAKEIENLLKKEKRTDLIPQLFPFKKRKS